ncbi:FecR family protein [Sphingobacterium paucimobilis]|uniref:FecR family protein n=1 Tax=Sphingobacterium paucimobilis TaxID=1385985 RepID=UPI00118440AC|nr:FecR family protein [Sphingobacterium paucimobilis]
MIKKIIDGQASDEDEKFVQNYFSQHAVSSEWDEDAMGQKQLVRQRLESNLRYRLNGLKRRKYIFNRLPSSVKYAAAILVIISVSWLLYEKSTRNVPIDIIANEVILPGSEKGTLTLSNGLCINLESLEVGESLEQGGISISRNEEGEISYFFSSVAEDGEQDHLIQNTFTTPMGGRLTVVLADGTKVWMNSASTLTFPNTFVASTREVAIKGEAYFEVAKNKNKPFIVHTGKTQIKVLGTSFNVNAYENENVTTLIEGSIELQSSIKKQTVLPGQRVAVNSVSDKMETSRADLEEIIAWKNNDFVFKNQDIKTIMKEISRWYDVEVEYRGNLDGRLFDVFVSRKKSLDQILTIIELTETVRFKIEGRRVIVTE